MKGLEVLNKVNEELAESIIPFAGATDQAGFEWVSFCWNTVQESEDVVEGVPINIARAFRRRLNGAKCIGIKYSIEYSADGKIIHGFETQIQQANKRK